MTVVLIPCPHSDLARPHYMVAGEEEHHLRKAHPEHYGRPEYPPNDTQYWSEHVQALAYSQQVKVQKFIENDCIEYVGGSIYRCKPIPGYNTTTYRLDTNKDPITCTCQGFKKNGDCAHRGALYQFWKLKKKPATVRN